MTTAISIDNLQITFKEKNVLDGLTIDIEEGKIYGLLGKNGSGKTTLLNAIMGNLLQAKEHVKIQGQNPYENGQILRQICMIRDYINFPEDYKGKHVLRYYHYFYPKYDKQLEKQLVKFFDLPLNIRITKYSKGMQTLLMNIIGLCCKADIVIYDEPTLGLDAVNRNHFYDILLQEYMKHSQTIILATHQIDEVENILENIMILDGGKITIEDTLEEFKAKAAQIIGSKASIDQFQYVEKIKEEKVFAGTHKAIIYSEVTKELKEELSGLNLMYEPLGLQEFFIEFAKGESFAYGANEMLSKNA